LTKAPTADTFFEFIPKNLDIYIIAVQVGCFSTVFFLVYLIFYTICLVSIAQDCSYEIPSGFDSFSFSNHHLLFTLLQYFGSEYEVIGAVSTSSKRSATVNSSSSSSTSSLPAVVQLSNVTAATSSNNSNIVASSSSRSTDTFSFARRAVLPMLSNVHSEKIQQKSASSAQKGIMRKFYDAKDKFKERFVHEDPTLASVVGGAVSFR
jgi:hypothetical protein